MPRSRKSLVCETCPGLKSCFMQSHLSQESIEDLKLRRHSMTFKRGELVYSSGDRPRGVWVLCSGRIKTYHLTDDGKALITSISGAGDILGHVDYLRNQDHHQFAEAIDECVVALLDSALIGAMMDREPTLARGLLQQLAQDLLHVGNMAVSIAYRPARERITDILNSLEDHAGKLDPNSPYPIVVAKRQQLAEQAGLTIETTVRTLKQMEKEGKIAIDGRRIALRTQLRHNHYAMA